MAQNVTIAGNQYPDVPSILVPKTGGGGNAIFADPSVVTAVAADVASGKYFLDSSGVLTQGTASGGGGASNLVTGTFTGTTTGAAIDVTLNYSGSGYPVVVVIYPTEGPYNSTTGSFYNLVQRYAIATYYSIKSETNSTPTYPSTYTTSKVNEGIYLCRYKSSATSALGALASGATTYNYRDTDAVSDVTKVLMIRSKTKMSVFIASTSYGFAANIEYKYWVIYSS